MEIVISATIAMVVLGLLFGIFLALASRIFAVHVDPRIEQIMNALPGANCGGCGYGGCKAYAEAVVNGEKIGLCPVGGIEAAKAVAAIMGVEVEAMAARRAVVHCQGGRNRCAMRADYIGQTDCRAAHITSGGPKACVYGCLGLGTCAAVCPFGAIKMSEERLPVIDADKCTACGMCVQTCPRGLITLLDKRYTIYLGCSSRDKGKAVKDICSVGCIACGLCAKKDPNGAIVMKGNLPVLDYEKSKGDFRVAAEVCPMNAYVVEGAQPALAGSGAAAARSAQ
jgi:electron transport complex protein RnfB